MKSPHPQPAPMEVIAVTGAAHGIGRQIALEAVARSAKTIWIIDRNDEGLTTLAAEIGGECDVQVRSVDLSDRTAIAEIAAVWASESAPDLLVNCAGLRHSASVTDTTDEEWDDTIAVNLTAAFLMTRAAARAMIAQQVAGVIVNIASVAGVIGFTERAAYNASKAGMIGLTKASALDLAPHGIRVLAVSPGFHASGISDDLPESMVTTNVPLNRRGDPAELAVLVHDLARSSYVTGSNIVVDGGSITGRSAG